MTDLVFEAPGRIVGRPPVQRMQPVAGQVLVEVDYLSLCGSDFGLFAGTYSGPRRYPLRFGHEWAGTVVDAPRESRLALGARVTGDCSRWCGRCELCGVDRNLCSQIEKFGLTRDGFSTRRRLVEERYLYEADQGLGARELALAELFAVAQRGVDRAIAEVVADEELLVVGAGPVGLATALLLMRAHGLRQVRVAEADAQKRRIVHERFPDVTLVEPPTPEALERVHSYRDLVHLGRYGVVFECSGAVAGLNGALLRARRQGLVVCFGLGRPGPVRTDLLVTKGLRLAGSIGGTGRFPEALAFLAEHGAEMLKMVTHLYPAESAQEAFETSIADPRRIKVQLRFGGDA
jgi:L-iditol 2-dehydrogenase